jgi:hypothetical protein
MGPDVDAFGGLQQKRIWINYLFLAGVTPAVK